MPESIWIGSPNFTPGRSAPIDTIVVHWMDGWLVGTDQIFQNTIRKTSAHYGVEDGIVHQYIKESDTAWHAGTFPANSRSIGIEHSAQPGRNATDATYATSIALIADICRRYQLDPYTAIKPHNEFFNTQCPGTLNLDRIKAGAKTALTTVTPSGEAITPITEGFLMALSDQDQTEVRDNLRKTVELLQTLTGMLTNVACALTETRDNARKVTNQTVYGVDQSGK